MTKPEFEVIIIGGSFAGLSAAMALGRSLKHVLIIDSGKPCNRQTPHAHNLITHDGARPSEISAAAKEQVMKYPTIRFENDLVTSLAGQNNAFEIVTQSGKRYTGQKILLATGVKDIMPDIAGFSDCWGVSVLHCPYCHGYEVRDHALGVLANGEIGFHMSMLIYNWSKNLCLFTNGPSELSEQQTQKLLAKGIKISEEKISAFGHLDGQIRNLDFANGSTLPLHALFAKIPFAQHSDIPSLVGCELTNDGYVKTDDMKRTNVPGIFAAGDNTSQGRALSVAIAAGTLAGAMINMELIQESF